MKMNTLSQRFSRFRSDMMQDLKTKHIEMAPPSPPYIDEFEYQVESFGNVPQAPPSPALSFEKLSPKNDRVARNDRSNTAATTFTCFGALPTEIRLLIWGMACKQQRRIDVEFDGKLNHLHQFGPALFKSNTPAPDVLYACKESREEALKHYSLCFRQDICESEKRQAKIWCNFDTDIIRLTPDGWGRRVHDGFLRQLATTNGISRAFNICNFSNYNPGCLVQDETATFSWTNIFDAIDSHIYLGYELQDIVLYYDAEDKPEQASEQADRSEFVEVDWTAMDPESQKTKMLQCAQRDLLKKMPSYCPPWEHRSFTETEDDSVPRGNAVWELLQSKVKLMELKVKH
ncbi:hypothetical protein EAF00_002671 [Botryotinia globosa]|nr:hypothetical protein EAF00_002671 [Botryotinia globosa]